MGAYLKSHVTLLSPFFAGAFTLFVVMSFTKTLPIDKYILVHEKDIAKEQPGPHDGGGKMLINSKGVSNGIGSVEKFDLSSFAAGTYFLKIDLHPSLGSVGKSGSYKIVRL